MSIHRRRIVQILNPVPGGGQYTTYKSALGSVRRGLAVFEADGAAMRFTDPVRHPQGSGSGDVGEGVLRWHRGKTGGMAQLLGSRALGGVETDRVESPGPTTADSEPENSMSA